MKLSKIAIGTVILGLLCASLVWQRMIIAETQVRVNELANNTATNEVLPQSTERRPRGIGERSRVPGVARAADPFELLRQLAGDLHAADNGDIAALTRSKRKIDAQSATMLVKLIEAIPDLQLPEDRSARVAGALLTALWVLSPERTARAGATLISDYRQGHGDGITQAVAQGLERWVQQSPTEALQWFEDMDAVNAFESASILDESALSPRNRVVSALAAGLYHRDRSKGMELIKTLEDREAALAIRSIGATILGWENRRPLAELALKLDERSARSAIRGLIRKATIKAWDSSLNYAPAAGEFIASLEATPDRKVALLVETVRPPNIDFERPVPKEQLLGSLAALDRYSPDSHRSIAKGRFLAEVVSSRSREHAFSVIDDLLRSHQVDDEMMATFVEGALQGSDQFPALFEFASSITEGSLRTQTIAQVAAAWSSKDPDSAIKALQDAGIDGAVIDNTDTLNK